MLRQLCQCAWRRPQVHSAFTLIEMLIAIAVVAVLAMLLMPLTQNIREKASETQCVSNLRLLGQVTLLYAQDNEGKMPYIAASSSIPGSVDRHWRRQFLPYLGMEITAASVRDTPFICPPHRELIESKNGIGGIPNYGMNIYLENLPLADIEVPARTLLATEAKLIGASPSEQLNESGIKSAVPGGKVHRGGQNILYVDGHIEWFENAQLLGDAPYASGGREDVWSPRR